MNTKLQALFKPNSINILALYVLFNSSLIKDRWHLVLIIIYFSQFDAVNNKA